MHLIRTFLLCLLAALLCSTPATAQNSASSVRIVDPIDEQHLVTLKGYHHPLANAANDRGAAADDMLLERIHLVLKRSDSQEQALRQLVTDLHTPGSASYHKWLTPDEFGAQFGPSDQDIATVQNWLAGHGFNVVKVNPGKQTIEFSGNVAQFREAFHSQIHKYEINGETRDANANDPQIPAALAPVVGGFVSLNNFPVKSYVRVLGKASYQPKTHQTTPQWTEDSAYSLVLAPADFAVQYDLSPLYQSGVNGAGQSIAIVNDSNIDIEQVNQFRSLFGLSANPPQIVIDGNDPGIDGINDYYPNYDSTEAYLDVEWAGAVAPAATVYLVIAQDSNSEGGLFLAAEHAVYSNIAPVISLSFGECEQFLGSTNSFMNSLWEQAAAQGITVMVSTGDSGSAGCEYDEYAVLGLGVNGFASTPYNVAVGGTDFYYSFWTNPTTAELGTYWNLTPTQLPQASLLQVVPEQPWNGSQYGLNIEFLVYGYSDVEGGGGGASSCAFGSGSATNGGWATCTGGYPKPSWQSGAGVPADTVRDIPDVSLFASDGWNFTYYPLCASDGDCQPVTGNSLIQITGVGGTSASSPAFAGMMALVNQQYGRQGQADFTLYPLKTQYRAAFHDVTHGSNSVPCNITTATSQYGTFPPLDCIAVGNPFIVDDPEFGTATEGKLGTGTTPAYIAAAGYNLATGLGTIDANQLVANWGSIKFASTTTTLTPSSTAFTAGSSITVSGTVTTASGTPTGEVALMTDSAEPGQQGLVLFTLNSGSFSGSVNNLPGGTYNIWGRYSGDTSNGPSTSAKTPITVSPVNSGLSLYIYELSSSGTKEITSGTMGIPYGTSLSSNAIVTLSSGAGTTASATGTVTFKDGSTTLSTAVVDAAGQAGYTSSTAFNAGSHSITASYSGDNSYNPSTSAAVTFSISQVTPTVSIAVPANPYTQGQASVITILVEGGRSGTAPSGSVTLTGVPAGTPTTATLSAGLDPISGSTVGLATVTIPSTAAAGSYTIGATYTPDSNSSTNYTTASTSGFALNITAASGIATTTSASASSGSTSPTAAVTISGTVTAASGTAPTGTVYLLVGYVNGGSASEGYIAAAYLTQGTGTSSTFSLVVSSQSLFEGTNEFTVYYYGSATDAPSSAVLNISNPFSDFTLTPQSSIVPVSAGSNATDTIYVASVNGFSGALSLACTAATGVTCSIPSSVDLASGSSTTATLTLSAPASTSSGSYNVLLTGSNSTGAFVHTLGIQAIVKGPLSITGPTTLPSGVAGMAYSQTLAASGGSGSGYSWTVTAGGSSLTAIGLSLSSSGVLSGASPTTGSASFTVKVTDSASNTATASFSVTITLLPTITGFTVSPNPVTGGGLTTVTITLSGAAPTGGAIVSLSSSNSTAYPAPSTYTVPAGQTSAQFTNQAGTVTTQTTVTVTASYNSSSQQALITVNPPPPSFTLSASPSSVSVPQNGSGTSTITVTDVGGFTGTVALAASGLPSGVTASFAAGTASGTQVLTLSASSTAALGGPVTLTIIGTSGALSATTTVSLTVTAEPSFEPSGAGGSDGAISVNPGATTGNTSTISVAGTNGYSGTVNLSCSISPTAANDPATCSLSPASVTLNGSTAETSTLKVTTTAATTGKNQIRKLFWPSAGGTVLALVLLIGVPRRRHSWLAMAGLAVLFALFSAIGCGGGGGGGSGGGGGNSGTSAGTYTITVTGTGTSSGSTSSVTATVGTVTLTVN